MSNAYETATLADCRGLLTHRPWHLVMSRAGGQLHVLRRHDTAFGARIARRDPGRALCGRRATWIDAALCDPRPLCPACVRSMQRLAAKETRCDV